MSRNFRKMVCRAWHERSQPAMEASSRAASRCFMFMYFLLPHWVPATWRSRAQTSMRAELPSGKLPTTRVRRRISRFSRLNDIIGTDAGPVFAGKIAVSQRFLNAVLHLLGGLFQLHGAQLLHHGFGLSPGRLSCSPGRGSP